MNSSINSGANNATWWQAALMIRGQTQAEQRNIRSVWIWCFAAGTGLVAAMKAFEGSQSLPAAVTWALAIIPVVLCIPAVLTCVRFIREADEFMRKVQLEGIAIGFAAGFVFCFGYHMLEHVGARPLPMIVALVPFVSGWAIGSFIVAYRHR